MAENVTPPAGGKELVGEVISAKMDKTIVVEVVRRVRHLRYQKVLNKYKKFYVHDEQRLAGVGDLVRVAATRPLSKLKRWRLVTVLKKAEKIEKVEA